MALAGPETVHNETSAHWIPESGNVDLAGRIKGSRKGSPPAVRREQIEADVRVIAITVTTTVEPAQDGLVPFVHDYQIQEHASQREMVSQAGFESDGIWRFGRYIPAED